MKIRFAGAARRVLLSTLIALGAAPLAAQAYTYSVLIDSDNDAATGCSVVTPNGTAAGIDARLDAEVSFEPLLVQTQALRLCSGGSFGAPQSLPAGHPVGADRGPGPSDVVELGFERALLGEDIASDWNLTFLASSPLLGAADAAGPVARWRSVRGDQHRRHSEGPAGVRAVRSRARRLHRRADHAARPLRAGRGRHAVPGRNR